MNPSGISDFFDYTCQHCGQPVCERQQLMNLSLGYEDDLFCLLCIAQQEALPVDTIRQTTRGYIQARDCFRKPWSRFDAEGCPLVATGQCPCQDSSDHGWQPHGLLTKPLP